jgi:hypothetical protein
METIASYGFSLKKAIKSIEFSRLSPSLTVGIAQNRTAQHNLI